MASFTFSHVGITVHDLDRVTDFFLGLGFELKGRAQVGGEWADRVNGLDGTDAEIAMVSAPDGSGAIELSAFRHPEVEGDSTGLLVNAHGLRHLAYEVDDVEAVVAKAHEAGYDLVRDLVDYQDVYRLAYIQGPEGIILEVAQPLNR